MKISYFQFPISSTRSRYENHNTLIGNRKWEIGNPLIGNGKSEIGNFFIGNRKSLELWNFGTLELWNSGTLDPHYWEIGNL